MPFTAGEVAYLRSQSLGRLATIGGAGFPHCVRAEADALAPADGPGGAELIRIHPVRIVAGGIDAGWGARAVGRTVGATLAHEGGQR
ncbi:hypothetical protein [Micromonospora sp. NBC_01412]|uniref:hypothetical protein n=1 Tax=Micromonospora sp. NBC_01412 TaxID=2903590 RepID=UPI0032546879